MKEKFAIFAGIKGFFGRTTFREMFEGSKEEAEARARQIALDEYDFYVGLFGIHSVEKLQEIYDIPKAEAKVLYEEKKEMAIEYRVEKL